MKNFKYVNPKSVKIAVASLGNDWKNTVVKGGGTDLLGEMKNMLITPKKVVNLNNIAALKFIKSTPGGNLSIATVWCGKFLSRLNNGNIYHCAIKA